MIKGIGHIGYSVSNLEKSLGFYCDILGLEKSSEIEGLDREPQIIHLRLDDGNYIELYYSKRLRSAESENNTGGSHLCLRVDDINEVMNTLKKKGIIKSDAKAKQGLTPEWRCWISDPDGNRIELMQMLHGPK